MPPKASKAAKGNPSKSSQIRGDNSESLKKGIDALCTQLQKALDSNFQKAEVKSTKQVRDAIDHALMDYRRREDEIPLDLAKELFTIVEAGGDHFCGRLSAEAFSLLVQLTMLSEYSREADRSLYLFAASIYYDWTTSRKNIMARKTSVGEHSLAHLLHYLVNTRKPDGIRKRVGMMCVQLLQDCELNCNRVGMGSEDIRRKLGTLVLEENDEFIRTICGRLIRILCDTGFDLSDMWPIDTDSTWYESFPSTGAQWDSRFSDFVDITRQRMGPVSESADQMFWGMNITVEPGESFGRPDHNLPIRVRPDSITIWAAADESTRKFDQSLEISLKNLVQVEVVPGSSQPDTSEVQLILDKSLEYNCYFDCKGCRISSVRINIISGDAEEIERLIREFDPKLILKKESDDQNSQKQASQVSRHSSDESERFTFALNAAVPENRTEHRTKPKITNSLPYIQTVDAIHAASASAPMAPKASSQSQAAPVTLAATAPPAHKPVESKEPHFAKPTKTKSKAKAPLRQSQSFSEKPGSLQIASQIRRVHGVTAASFPNYIEQNLKELGRRLPGQAEPTLRGALTVSGGDVDSAVVSLTTSTRAIATSDGPRKIKSHLEDDSITTPEPNDASTPRITKPNEKSTTGVTAVLKTRIQQLNQEFVPAKTAEIQDATSGTASDVDEFFDIPEDPYPTAQPNRSVENKAVARAQPATKAVKPKPSIMDVKKRKSAPAILGMTSQAPLRGKRSQRAAAAKASQVMHEVVEDDYEDNKELDQIDRVVVKSSKQRRSQNASRGIESMHTATQKKNESEATLNKKSQSNKRQKDFLPCDAQVEDIRTDSDYEELYSASPVKAPRQPKPESKNMKAAPIGKKRVANSLGDVASKLDSMFSDPEAKMGLSQPMVLPAQPGISRQLVQVTKPSSNQELDHPVQPKIPNQSTARDAESYMQDDDPAQISTVVEKHVDASTPKDQDVRQESESRGKRKAVLKTGSSSKRRRAEILGGPPLHSSPRNLAEEDSKKSEARRSAVKKKSPTRRSTRFSPRLRARELESRRLEDDSPAPENLVDDHLARKQPIISFGAKGAKNQGVSSSVIRSAARKPENSLHVQQPDGTNGFSDRKRKLAKTTGKDEQLTKKYKSGAPLEVIQNPFNHSRDDDEEFRSSPPQAVLSYDGMIQIPSADEELPEVHPIEGQKHSQKASIASRKSSGFEKRESQLSHVDMNGSPITALQIDHIGRAHQKLSKIAPIQPESLHSPSPAGPLFGQKIHLTGITKARPSSPAEVNTQFVPHHKTADGSYQGIATKEVIAPEKALSDPFFQKTAHQTSNGFTNRLVSGLTPQQGNAHVSDQISKPLKSLPPNVDRKQPQKAPKLPSRQEDMPPSNSSSDDSESDDSESDDSSEQQSIESSVESVEDDNHPGSRWHVALRPHYSKLSDAVHRVADEVILRLSNEEDVVGLLVDQYKDGGAKILGSHIQGRDAQKVNMQSQINHKRRKLVKIYGDARSGVEKRKTAIEKSTVTRFEKIWKQEQDSLQTKISQRRRSSLC